MWELLKHLHKQGKLWSYLWFLTGRHRRVLAYVLVVIATAYAVYAVNQVGIDREREAQIVACERVQILRDQTNGLALFAYDTYVEAAKRERALAKTDKQDADTHIGSAKSFEVVYRTMVVTGPTDCHDAVDKPLTYPAPRPKLIYLDGPVIQEVRKRSEAIVVAARKAAGK